MITARSCAIGRHLIRQFDPVSARSVSRIAQLRGQFKTPVREPGVAGVCREFNSSKRSFIVNQAGRCSGVGRPLSYSRTLTLQGPLASAMLLLTIDILCTLFDNNNNNNNTGFILFGLAQMLYIHVVAKAGAYRGPPLHGWHYIYNFLFLINTFLGKNP